MRFLLLSSLVLLFAACRSVYTKLQPAQGDTDCILKFKPKFTSDLYTTHVNVVGKHLSGLLLFKPISDSSTRVVFSNEMGIKFFDFEFFTNGNFKVHYVTKQMNRKSVLKALRKDFEMILMNDLAEKQPSVFTADGYRWYGYARKKENDYYIVDSICSGLIRIEKGSYRKPKVEAVMLNYRQGIPDSIGFTHKLFDFTIGLKYIPR